MTIPRLTAMNRYWRKFPPSHVCLRAGFGIKSRDEEPVKAFDDFVKDFMAIGGRIDGVK